MATEVERLIVRLEATQNRFEKQMARASQTANRAAYRIENRFKGMNANIAGSFAAIGGTAAIGGALVAFQQLVDANTRIQNALKVTGLQGEALTQVYNGLFAAAQRNGVGIESLAQLYSRAALVQKELGVSQQELVAFTDRVALALRVAGTDAGAASGALLQLSQALGAGTVRAEEFNSILEGAPTIAQAAAAGLKEAGGSVAALRQLVIDGKLSSEAFFRAFEAGAPMLEARAATATATLSQEMTRLRNELINAAGSLDQATNASAYMAGALGEAADAAAAFSDAVTTMADSALGSFIGRVAEAIGQLQSFYKMMGYAPGLLKMTGGMISDVATGKPLGSYLDANQVQKRIDDAFAARGAPMADRGGRIAGGASAAVNPVSLSDFRAPVGTGGAGGKSRAKSESDYQREAKAIQEKIAALNAETAAMANLNPLQADYEMQLTKARVAQELLTAAQKSGVEITPQVKANIDQLATSYAQAEQAAKTLADAQEDAMRRAEDATQLARDVTQGFISDMMSGVSASEALANALQKVADKLLNEVLDALFQVNSAGGGGGGILGFLTGLLGLGGGIPGFGGTPLPGPFPAAPVGIRSGAISARSAGVMSAAGAGRSSGGVQEIRVVGVFVDDGGVVKGIARNESSMVTREGIKRYDETGKQRFGRDANESRKRGFTR